MSAFVEARIHEILKYPITGHDAGALAKSVTIFANERAVFRHTASADAILC